MTAAFFRFLRQPSRPKPQKAGGEERERSLLRKPEDALAFVITASLVPQFDIV
jgi:hypothetical protein